MYHELEVSDLARTYWFSFQAEKKSPPGLHFIQAKSSVTEEHLCNHVHSIEIDLARATSYFKS